MFQRNGNVRIPIFVIGLIMLAAWLTEQLWIAVTAFFVLIIILFIKMPLDQNERPKDRITQFGPALGEGNDWYWKR